MNRPIKFRAWDKSYSKYLYSDTLQGLSSFFAIIEGDRERFGPLEQFTGLIDAKGGEIYEGDVIKNENVAGKDNPLVVKWYESRSGFSPFIWWNEHETKECEVIGDIYENPDLLSV